MPVVTELTTAEGPTGEDTAQGLGPPDVEQFWEQGIYLALQRHWPALAGRLTEILLQECDTGPTTLGALYDSAERVRLTAGVHAAGGAGDGGVLCGSPLICPATAAWLPILSLR